MYTSARTLAARDSASSADTDIFIVVLLSFLRQVNCALLSTFLVPGVLLAIKRFAFYKRKQAMKIMLQEERSDEITKRKQR